MVQRDYFYCIMEAAPLHLWKATVASTDNLVHPLMPVVPLLFQKRFLYPVFKRPIHALSGGNYLQICAEREGLSGKFTKSAAQVTELFTIYTF